ncbi:hypothetical protein HAHE_01860 [Haloferula helveola]|uniref:Uncharacterized protein n=1 Tax=Haloferula helveola TaxID=490095 RepID=A0ABN6GYE8_9BACT|nr:hypothetical protein HAHE_01860 [Haloferula helveola]
MNWNYFNIFGYLGVLLWLSMPLLWMVHSRMKPRRWLCHVALVVGLVALMFAELNSSGHVNRIQLDRTEELAAREAEQQAKVEAVLESRGDEVAQIRFAEDDGDDFLDQAGMDEADLKYMEKLRSGEDPAWKKEKKTRSGGSGEEGGLEDMIGAVEETEGVDSETLDEAIEEDPIVMSAKDLETANRLDGLNLKVIRALLWIAVLVIIVDYLRRVNVYREAYLPLPLPSSWVNAAAPMPARVERPGTAERSLAQELQWLSRRGDSFLCVTDDGELAKSLPSQFPRPPLAPMELIRLESGQEKLGDDFVFESLWHGRSSFVTGSVESAERMLGRFVELMKKRRETRAKVRQTVHVVWDAKRPISPELEAAFVDAAALVGFSLFIVEPGAKAA